MIDKMEGGQDYVSSCDQDTVLDTVFDDLKIRITSNVQAITLCQCGECGCGD